MQTQRVLETITWIRHQFLPIEKLLFSVLPKITHGIEEEAEKKGNKEDDLGGVTTGMFFQAIQSSGLLLAQVRNNPDALQVLDAFNLKALHEGDFVLNALSGPLASRGTREGPNRESAQQLFQLRTAWKEMLGCIVPFTTLTVPAELRSGAETDHLLNLQIEDRPELSINTLSDVLKATTTIFEAIAKVYGHPEDRLGIVKIESGSSITLSFKGVADTVKEFKNLVVEIWSKHRHKRADEIINVNLAMESSIDVLTRIDGRVKKGSLDSETALRLKRAILNNTFSLFKDGVLLADIPHIEIVDNHQLLNAFTSPKLISAPSEIATSSIEKDKPQKTAGQKKRGKPVSGASQTAL
jgi:hypothetical protein